MPPPRPPPGDTTERPAVDKARARTEQRAQLEHPADPEGVNDDTRPSTPGARRDLLIDTHISGYHVQGVIGRGAAGIVYRAEHLISGKRAAFKVLKPEFAGEPEYIRRIIEEARALTAIRHRGIIDILDFGALPNGQPYLVMELCDGMSLEEQLKFGGKPSIPEALGLLDELMDALGAAHDCGIVHRDVKPSNLFLAVMEDGARVLKVLDFGLARRGDGKASTRPTIPGVMVGTPDYMAPEQIEGKQMGPASDVYAVGGIAFRLLTNRLPFVGATGIAVITRKMSEPPPHPRDADPSVPIELDQLVFAMLAQSPEKRPSLREARSRLSAYRASLRGGPLPSLNDDDPSSRPTLFHQAPQLGPEPAEPPRKLVWVTEVHLRPPKIPDETVQAAAPTPVRRPDLELQPPNEGPSTDQAMQAMQTRSGARWLVGALVILALLGAGAWYLLHPPV